MGCDISRIIPIITQILPRGRDSLHMDDNESEKKAIGSPDGFPCSHLVKSSAWTFSHNHRKKPIKWGSPRYEDILMQLKYNAFPSDCQ
jgi:hypothetical protein